MPGGIGGERRNNGRRSILLKQYPLVLPEDDMLFGRYVLFVTYMLMAVTGFGYLALTWSTVVLLGGFVTALQKEDFWSLTIISMMQAASNILARLAGLLATKKNTIYRTIAAEILENLCTHCDWNEYKLILTETLLPKVLTEIMSIRIDQPESKISEEETNKPQARRWLLLFKRKNYQGNQKNYAAGNNKGEQKNSVPGKDEENQQNFQLGSEEQGHKNCAPEGKNEIQEISSSEDENKSSDQQNEEQAAPKELQEALLSLALVICDKLISAGDVVQLNALRGEAFVRKLKTVIDGNCQPTADSLRIVKLCGRIVASMMQCQPYAELFRNKEFVQSLSKASKIMSCLESRMMFAGSDFGLKKTIRPLLYELEKEVYELENKAEHSGRATHVLHVTGM